MASPHALMTSRLCGRKDKDCWRSESRVVARVQLILLSVVVGCLDLFKEHTDIQFDGAIHKSTGMCRCSGWE